VHAHTPALRGLHHFAAQRAGNELVAEADADQRDLPRVEFTDGAQGVVVTVTFDAETIHTEDEQRQGWQAILDNFARHVGKTRAPR